MNTLRLLLVLSVFTSTNLSAQNWSLVMPNDTLVYEKLDNHQFFTVWVDSTQVTGSDTTYFMNRISPGEKIGNAQFGDTCAGSNYSFYSHPIEILRESGLQFIGGSITITGTKEIIDYDSAQIIIYTQKPVGSLWVADSLLMDTMKVTLVDTAYLESYEVVDSIKVLEFKNQQLIISKNHGIVQGCDFLRGKTFYQIGVQNLNKGTTIPMGMEYFDFEVGDIYVRWIEKYDEYGPSFAVKKNKIVSKSIINDTLIYGIEIEGPQLDTEWKYWPNINPMLNAFPNIVDSASFVYLKYQGFNKPVILTPVLIYRNNENQIVRYNYSGGYYHGFALCRNDSGFVSYYGPGPKVRYIKGLGAISEGVDGVDSGEYNVLKGYIKNGIPHGDTTSVQHITYSKNITIYPNPTNQFITIETEKSNGTSIVELYDLQGRLTTQKTFEKNVQMDVSPYASGVYFLVIKDDNGFVLHREKIIIQ